MSFWLLAVVPVFDSVFSALSASPVSMILNFPLIEFQQPTATEPKISAGAPAGTLAVFICMCLIFLLYA